jgi:hypothetical protein
MECNVSMKETNVLSSLAVHAQLAKKDFVVIKIQPHYST